VGGEAETVNEDFPPGPEHTAEGGAAACSEDSPLSADQDVGQAGEEESSVASTDAESDDSTNVPPAVFIVEDPAADDADLIGLPEPVIQDAVSSNEMQLPEAQFREVAKYLAIFTYAVNQYLTEAALADLLKLSCCDS